MYKLRNYKLLLSLLLCAVILLGVLPGQVRATEDPAATLEMDANGYYLIATADDLYAFAALVNSGETDINGKLTEDIEVNEAVLEDGALSADTSSFRQWTPIGNNSTPYAGTLEGNQKTVTGLYFNSTTVGYAGLVGAMDGGTVRNVGVCDSYFNGKEYVGGIVGNLVSGEVTNCFTTNAVNGLQYGGGIAGYNKGGTLSKCANSGSVYDKNAAGGIAGSNGGTILNCFNTGKITGSFFGGGIAGSSAGTVTNCYSTGKATGSSMYAGGIVGYDSAGTISNCYYLTGTAPGGIRSKDVTGSAEARTEKQFLSGEVAYLLNGSTSEGTLVWGQTVNTHPAPVLGGAAVYQLENTGGCTAYGEYLYSNDPAMEIPTHSYSEGFCTACGGNEPAVKNGNVYEISNVGQLLWFADQVNSGETAINGKLMADLVLNENVLNGSKLNGTKTDFTIWTPIGTTTAPYIGTFDGNKHTVSGLVFEDTTSYAGFFGAVGSGGKVTSLTLTDSWIYGRFYLGGIAGRNDGTIENCTNGAVITTTFVNGSTVGYVGGIAGYSTGTISGCTNLAKVTCNKYLCGYYLGGITGYSSGSITNCTNRGNVSGGQYMGGITGYSTAAVSCCTNYGEVSGTSDIGGIAGVSKSSISNCANLGKYTASSRNFGGIAGSNSGTVNSCYSTGKGSTASVHTPYAIANGTVSNCYYLATKEATDGGRTEAQFASGEVAWLLNGQSAQGVWKQTLETELAPGFTGATVYQLTDCQGSISYSNTNREDGFHTYEYGICIRCDEPAGPFDLSGANMTLANSLEMNFAFRQSHRSDWTGCYAEIVKSYADGREDLVETVTADNWVSTCVAEDACFYATFSGIAAKEMTDNVAVTIYDAEGNAISNTWNDSIRSYIMRNIDTDNFTAAMKTLAVDMLNYGTAAQTYFGYNTSDLATDELTDTHKGYATQSAACTDSRVKGDNYLGTRLTLESSIILEYAFKGVTSDMSAKVTFIDHYGDVQDVETSIQLSDNVAMVTIDEIVVADGRQEVTCQIYDGETLVAEVTDSVASYAARMSNGDDIFDMLMRFSDSAYAYFH